MVLVLFDAARRREDMSATVALKPVADLVIAAHAGQPSHTEPLTAWADLAVGGNIGTSAHISEPTQEAFRMRDVLTFSW